MILGMVVRKNQQRKRESEREKNERITLTSFHGRPPIAASDNRLDVSSSEEKSSSFAIRLEYLQGKGKEITAGIHLRQS